jgi:hypothetical protein
MLWPCYKRIRASPPRLQSDSAASIRRRRYNALEYNHNATVADYLGRYRIYIAQHHTTRPDLIACESPSGSERRCYIVFTYGVTIHAERQAGIPYRTIPYRLDSPRGNLSSVNTSIRPNITTSKHRAEMSGLDASGKLPLSGHP